MIETKVAAKLITGLQAARDACESAGDSDSANSLSSAISCVIMASSDADLPAPTQDQVDDLQRMAALTPDFYRRSLYTNDFILKSARLAAFGNRPLRRVKSAQQLAKRGKG